MSSHARQRNFGFRRAAGRGIFRNYDRSESLGPAAFHHERRLDYPFDSRSHECARPKPKPCGSARPRRRQDRTALSQGFGGALFRSRRRRRDRTRRRTSNGRPGRCDPHPFRRVAHDHGYTAAALSLLLRTALYARGYVSGITSLGQGFSRKLEKTTRTAVERTRASERQKLKLSGSGL
jgi:hypothetical protein